MRRRPAPVLAALVLATLLAACGDGGGASDGGGTESEGQASATRFLDQYCSTVKAYQQESQRFSQQMATELQQVSSPRQAKSTIDRLFGQVVRNTGQVISQIKAIEPPDVPNGEQEVQEVVSALTQVKTAVANLRDRIDKLPTNDEQAFQTGVQGAFQQFATELSGLDREATRFQSPELKQAAEKNPDCEGLT